MAEMRVSPQLLSVLVCPVTGGTLHYDVSRQELISSAAGLAYPIMDGVPIVVASTARELSVDEKQRWAGK